MPDDAAQAALALLREVRSSEPADEAVLGRALDRSFWRELCGELSVEGAAGRETFEADPISQSQLEELGRRIQLHGYFHAPPTLDVARLERLALAVEHIREQGWHPSFCFVYDEAWLTARTPSLARLVQTALGPEYRQIPKVWCHRVDPSRRSSGWTPHCDGYDREWRDGRLSVWVPLTEANLENGCMYVVPRDMRPDPEHDGMPGAWLRGARALPTRPGHAMGWDFHTLHWGGSCSGYGGTARMGLSFEFIARDATPHAEEVPLIAAGDVLPTFEQRLSLIAHGILEYGRFEPALARYASLAQGLQRSLAQPA